MVLIAGKLFLSVKGEFQHTEVMKQHVLDQLSPQLPALLYETLVSIMWQKTSFPLFLSYGAAKPHFILLLASQIDQ